MYRNAASECIVLIGRMNYEKRRSSLFRKGGFCPYALPSVPFASASHFKRSFIHYLNSTNQLWGLRTLGKLKGQSGNREQTNGGRRAKQINEQRSTDRPMPPTGTCSEGNKFIAKPWCRWAYEKHPRETQCFKAGGLTLTHGVYTEFDSWLRIGLIAQHQLCHS